MITHIKKVLTSAVLLSFLVVPVSWATPEQNQFCERLSLWSYSVMYKRQTGHDVDEMLEDATKGVDDPTLRMIVSGVVEHAFKMPLVSREQEKRDISLSFAKLTLQACLNNF